MGEGQASLGRTSPGGPDSLRLRFTSKWLLIATTQPRRHSFRAVCLFPSAESC